MSERETITESLVYVENDRDERVGGYITGTRALAIALRSAQMFDERDPENGPHVAVRETRTYEYFRIPDEVRGSVGETSQPARGETTE